MKVYVVMGNDYPSRVYKTRRGAAKFIEEKEEYDVKRMRETGGPKIYWRSYEFDVIDQ